MPSKATTVDQYLKELPEDRRIALNAIRNVILANVDKGIQEGIQYGMIGYFIPHSIFPAGYHCDPKQPVPFICLASQKNHISVHLMSIYSDGVEEGWFRKEWEKTGRKLDMGKACVRFKRLEDAALDVIGAAIKRVSIARYLEAYQAARTRTSSKPTAAKKAGSKKAAKKKSR